MGAESAEAGTGRAPRTAGVGITAGAACGNTCIASGGSTAIAAIPRRSSESDDDPPSRDAPDHPCAESGGESGAIGGERGSSAVGEADDCAGNAETGC